MCISGTTSFNQGLVDVFYVLSSGTKVYEYTFKNSKIELKFNSPW